MENNQSENFDFNLDEIIKSSENENKVPPTEIDPIKNPNGFSKKIFDRKPLKIIEKTEEDAKKIEEARNKIKENHQSNS